jgi:predicted acylesterase/phospholipase RssA
MADPSAFVRASMSVPLFFTPYEITGIPKNDPKVQKAWDDTGYPTDAIPDKARNSGA